MQAGETPGHPASVKTGEDAARAQLYRLLSGVLTAPPSAEFLHRLAQLDADDTPLGAPLAELALCARETRPAAVDDEYHALFIGLGRGELVPFGSYYLTGFLHEKPLAKLRADMARLGIARADGVREPEDHIASLCEMMAGLIDGAFGTPASIADQRRFFEQHLGGWADRFFEDLEQAAAAQFYRPVGTLGRVFMSIEASGLEMAA